MRGLCLLITNLSLQCTDNIQHIKMSSQTKKKDMSPNKSHEDKSYFEDRMRTTGHHTGEHRHFPKSSMVMSLIKYLRERLRCFSSRRV